MSPLDDWTLISCSFNTPEVTLAMLRSFAAHHPGGPHPLVLIENSTEPVTARLLDAEGVPYIPNPGGRHSPSVDLALERCATGHALLVDTDVLFLRPLDPILEGFRRHDLTLLGRVEGDRGGHRLHPRVHPWFCLIDVERVRERGIRFHDAERIERSGSGGFYGEVPIQDVSDRPLYDVGATFYEDVDRAGLRIGDTDLEGVAFLHFEGMSWHRRVDDAAFQDIGARTRTVFDTHAAASRDVSLRGRYVAPDLDAPGEPARTGNREAA